MGTWQGQSWYSTPELDNLISQTYSETDPVKLQALYNTIQEKIVDACPFIWLSNPNAYVAHQSWVHGFTWRSTLGEYMWLPNITVEAH